MELYESDLEAILDVMRRLEGISKVPGIFSAEIRVKVDDTSWWVVIGWGEAGDPCILRFETDNVTNTYPQIHIKTGGAGFIQPDPTPRWGVITNPENEI